MSLFFLKIRSKELNHFIPKFDKPFTSLKDLNNYGNDVLSKSEIEWSILCPSIICTAVRYIEFEPSTLRPFSQIQKININNEEKLIEKYHELTSFFIGTKGHLIYTPDFKSQIRIGPSHSDFLSHSILYDYN